MHGCLFVSQLQVLSNKRQRTITPKARTFWDVLQQAVQLIAHTAYKHLSYRLFCLCRKNVKNFLIVLWKWELKEKDVNGLRNTFMDLRVNVESIFRNENANVACLHFNHMLRQLRHTARPRYACNITFGSRGTCVSRLRAPSKYELSSLLVNYCLILEVPSWWILTIWRLKFM